MMIRVLLIADSAFKATEYFFKQLTLNFFNSQAPPLFPLNAESP